MDYLALAKSVIKSLTNIHIFLLALEVLFAAIHTVIVNPQFYLRWVLMHHVV